MSIPDPSWKIKTRPCPFYSQGRCLFSDSCNFLHDAKIKVKPSVYDASSVLDSMELAASPPSIHVSGVTTPPPRASLDAATEFIYSPPRSPRLSSLLLALGTALEPEQETGWGHQNQQDAGKDDFMDGAGEVSGGVDGAEAEEGDDEGDSVYLAYEDDTVRLPVANEPLLESSEDSPSDPDSDPRGIGEGSHDGQHDAAVAQVQPPSSPISTEPPPNEAGLLSPIEIKLATAAPRSLPLGNLETMCHREDSIDSGYADNWTGPAPLAISPPRSERRFSTLSILSSPFGTPSARVLSPTFGPAASSGWPATTLFSAKSSVVDETETMEREPPPETDAFMDDLDSPSDYKQKRYSSSSRGSLNPAIDVEATVKPPVANDLHDEGFDESASDDDDDDDLGVAYLLQTDDTRHSHQPLVRTSEGSPSAKVNHQEATILNPVDVFEGTDTHITPTQDILSRAAEPDVVEEPSFVDETPVKRRSRPGSRPAMLFVDSNIRSPMASAQPMSSDAGTSVMEEDSYIAAYTVGSSPDFDPDTSGELVSSNAPSPFTLYVAERTREAANFASFVESSTNSDPDQSASNLYDEYYSSVPVSPAGSYSYLAHALDDHHPITSTPPSRVPTPSSTRALVFTPPGSAPSQSPMIPNFSTPFRSQMLLSSPHLSPSSASATSRPPSQLGSARLSLKSPLVSPAHPPSPSPSPSPVDPSSTSSTKVPFGFRHSARARSREPSASSIHTFGNIPTSRHRPPALIGLSNPSEGQSRSSSVGSSHSAEPRLVSPEPQIRSASPRRLKPLRLSLLFNPSSSSTLASSSSAFPPSLTTATTASSHTPSSPTVSSNYSISNNHPVKSPRSSRIPNLDTQFSNQPHSAPATDNNYSSLSRRQSWQHRISQDRLSKQSSSRRSSVAHVPTYTRPSSRLSEMITFDEEEEELDFTAQCQSTEVGDDLDDTVRLDPLSAPSPVPVFSRPPSVLRSPVHAIATPRPTLLFAIASDDVDEVRRVLESGEAGPNDDVGPQSALAFAVTANQLKHKQEIVRLLLAHGANTSVLNGLQSPSNSRSASPSESQPGGETPSAPKVMETLDPATRYFISRAEAPQTRRASSLIHRSFFRPLAKVRYDLVGQDRALEQLFRVLSMPTGAPIVVLLCGPSGHGKSLLARRFGSLLDVPTHTVNMTTLTSTHDIWRSYSMSPFEEPSTSTLGDFLTEHQGKRCVVVLDEIEKVENQKYLSSLLMPWELGRCSFGAGQRHVDVSKVIWLGTSNIGHDLVFEHQMQRVEPSAAMTREEYVDLMGLLRPQVSDRLGPSLLSRVTTVLPFVPFSDEEKMAIAAEALHSLTLTADESETPALPAATVEKLVKDSLRGYVPAEGARSLYRAVSNLLLDTIY